MPPNAVDHGKPVLNPEYSFKNGGDESGTTRSSSQAFLTHIHTLIHTHTSSVTLERAPGARSARRIVSNRSRRNLVAAADSSLHALHINTSSTNTLSQHCRKGDKRRLLLLSLLPLTLFMPFPHLLVSRIGPIISYFLPAFLFSLS